MTYTVSLSARKVPSNKTYYYYHYYLKNKNKENKDFMIALDCNLEAWK